MKETLKVISNIDFPKLREQKYNLLATINHIEEVRRRVKQKSA